MAKITDAWIRQNEPEIENIESTSFRFAHSSTLYSYVEFTAWYDGDKCYSKQISVEEFFDWIGANILKFNCS